MGHESRCKIENVALTSTTGGLTFFLSFFFPVDALERCAFFSAAGKVCQGVCVVVVFIGIQI